MMAVILEVLLVTAAAVFLSIKAVETRHLKSYQHINKQLKELNKTNRKLKNEIRYIKRELML